VAILTGGSAGSDDLLSTISMPVADLGNESFCGCYVVSLTDTRTEKVVSVDSTAWIYHNCSKTGGFRAIDWKMQSAN